jgi:hypothetical protein
MLRRGLLWGFFRESKMPACSHGATGPAKDRSNSACATPEDPKPTLRRRRSESESTYNLRDDFWG